MEKEQLSCEAIAHLRVLEVMLAHHAFVDMKQHQYNNYIIVDSVDKTGELFRHTMSVSYFDETGIVNAMVNMLHSLTELGRVPQYAGFARWYEDYLVINTSTTGVEESQGSRVIYEKTLVRGRLRPLRLSRDRHVDYVTRTILGDHTLFQNSELPGVIDSIH